MTTGSAVRHPVLGMGEVLLDRGETVVVRFEHGIEECRTHDLTPTASVLDGIHGAMWAAPLKAITRVQAEAIVSVNDRWGVLSRSRIALLPHQLWVCKQVIAQWPTRWLIADDVGLGKTIEAGLILWPLLAQGLVKRLLVLCPSSLVPQWQQRLRLMFDIRLTAYSGQADTEAADFWGSTHQVVASLQTLRLDHKNRHERMFDSATPPWDLLIVDEAHHLNSAEHLGASLGYEFVRRLEREKRVTSLLFFTGTPHRGKNYGFLSLLNILRPDLFTPQKPLADQLSNLRHVMIRNNKQSVTDVEGTRLFSPPHVISETYTYSPAEERFYAMLTDFFISGRNYASSLGQGREREAVMLVLISMQKLASSSVEAIRRALKGRLQRMADTSSAGYGARKPAPAARRDMDSDDDDAQQQEDTIINDADSLILMRDEIERLRALIAAANDVGQDTKIQRIIALIDQHFRDRSVLLFTEYKATQSLMMSALIAEFGNGCVTFINGDDRAEGVVTASGAIRSLRASRQEASDLFNQGKVRFLVSTEAGGEGIDLQERCHSLIHVDLPWNPMRLHQRVGRLNRYGQKKVVEVITLRNPNTVEALIWDKLNSKISQIKEAFDEVMDEPEDLLQLVLGMTSPDLLTGLLADAQTVSRDSLATWFDSRTASLGDQDVISTVKQLVGHSNRFDFSQVRADIPRLDLPDLEPFVRAMLTLNSRAVKEGQDGLSFRTPESWVTQPGARDSYERLIFDRQDRSRDAQTRILGVGHKVIDRAVQQARAWEDAVATALPIAILPHVMVVYRLRDRVTTHDGVVKTVVVGVSYDPDRQEVVQVRQDWQLLIDLNTIIHPGMTHINQQRRQGGVPRPAAPEDIDRALRQTQQAVENMLPKLDVSFKIPAVDLLAVLWPQPSDDHAGLRGQQENPAS